MWDSGDRGRPASTFRFPATACSQGRRGGRLALLVLLCAAAASGCGRADGDEAPRGPVRRLAQALDAPPALTPRLSIAKAGTPCSAAPGDRASCAGGAGNRPSDRVNAIIARAQRAVHEHADPNAMHALALIDLLYGSDGKSLQRAISSLQTAARLAERPAPVLADLAAAYLVRAERDHTLRDLLAAVEAATEALEREPGNRAARFNLALALERLELPGEAEQEWRRYLSADSASGWADEARRHLARVLATPTAPAPPTADAPPATYAAYADTEPQGAREVGWCRVLGAWAAAALAGDTAGAERQLSRAEALGTALEHRAGGDATLADGVRAIRARARGPGLRRLAEAHREFSAGCELERQLKFATAERPFAAADSLADGSPTLRAWARLLHANAVFKGGDTATAVFRELSEGADSVRHPALAGRARHQLAAPLLRGDRYARGLEPASEAHRLFVRAGEGENEGSVLQALGIASVQMRDMDRAYAFAWLALERLRPYRSSYRLHNALRWLAVDVAAEDGFPRAALRIQNEGVRVAERTGLDMYVAEARLARASLFATAGDSSRTWRDVAVAEAAMARAEDPDSTVRRWMVSKRQVAEAALLRTDPRRAAGTLDSAATFFERTMSTPLVALPIIVAGAHARLAAGDVKHGAALLDSALKILERRRDQIRMEPRRAAVFEEARTVVDRATMLKLASGDTAEALRYLDRGRASLATVGARTSRDTGRAAAGRRGEVALVYALVGDTLLAWTVAGKRVELYRTVLDTARLVRTIEQLRRRLEDRAGEAASREGEVELRRGLAQLYGWLVRPLEAWLGAAETPLVVIADGDLGSVPFAALYDAHRGRYLVQDHPLRFAASLREAGRPARRAGGGASLFVADPAFDPREHPGFPRLAEAADEARQIAGWYPRPQVLSDTGATRSELRAALLRAGLVHYAGHAVFDDERPERSYLLLAPSPGDSTAGATLQAEDIAKLDLHQLSLVVLAACQTVRTGPGRAAGFSGLAGAFLAAGAGGAVGSLWEVDDRLTRPLMLEFHRAYRAAPDGAGALRAAQLHLLASGDPALRSPAAWAGFRYAGN